MTIGGIRMSLWSLYKGERYVPSGKFPFFV